MINVRHGDAKHSFGTNLKFTGSFKCQKKSFSNVTEKMASSITGSATRYFMV